jgi:hypothetical protein
MLGPPASPPEAPGCTPPIGASHCTKSRHMAIMRRRLSIMIQEGALVPLPTPGDNEPPIAVRRRVTGLLEASQCFGLEGQFLGIQTPSSPSQPLFTKKPARLVGVSMALRPDMTQIIQAGLGHRSRTPPSRVPRLLSGHGVPYLLFRPWAWDLIHLRDEVNTGPANLPVSRAPPQASLATSRLRVPTKPWMPGSAGASPYRRTKKRGAGKNPGALHVYCLTEAYPPVDYGLNSR